MLSMVREANRAWNTCQASQREEVRKTLLSDGQMRQFDNAQAQAAQKCPELAVEYALGGEGILRDISHAEIRVRWWREAIEVFSKFGGCGRNAHSSAVQKPEYHEILTTYGNVLREVGDTSEAERIFRMGLALFKPKSFRRLNLFSRQEANEPPALLMGLGLALWQKGELKKADRYLERAINNAKSQHDRVNEAIALGNRGLVFSELHENIKAKNCHEQALKIAEGLKLAMLEEMESNQLGNLGIIYFDLGMYEKAVTFLKKARDRHASHGRRLGVFISEIELTKALVFAGKLSTNEAVQRLRTVAENVRLAGYTDALRCAEQTADALETGLPLQMALAALNIRAADGDVDSSKYLKQLYRKFS